MIVVHTTAMFGDENPIGTLDIYVDWPDSEKEPDEIWRHSQARELITTSFLDPEMASADGIAFGANALGY